jgi:hypothetical protein
MDAPAARDHVRTAEDLQRDGLSARRIRAAVGSGELIAVHPGRFVESSVWNGAFEEDRHLLRVVGAMSATRGGSAVASHVSAAVLHRLPLFRHPATSPHFSGEHMDGRVRGPAPVCHHDVRVPLEDRVERQGIACTSLERTVFDVIRTVGRETALACADAALRQIAWRGSARQYDPDAADEWRSSLLERVARSGRARGVRQARWVAAFADGRAQLPGESLSRLYFNDLGFAPPLLQVPFPGPRGTDYLIDFGLEDVKAWGEFDGLGKYFDAELGGDPAGGRDTLLREKEREDWIRGTSGRPVIRWGMRHLTSSTTFRQRLARFHIHPLPPSRRRNH